jgi:hypothetical protein
LIAYIWSPLSSLRGDQIPPFRLQRYPLAF